MADIKFDNPNFNKEKYGKYFDDKGKIKDINGWMNEKNKDLKSSSDPLDLVNRINKNRDRIDSIVDRYAGNMAKFLKNDKDYDGAGEAFGEDLNHLGIDAGESPKTFEEAKNRVNDVSSYRERNGFKLTDQIKDLLKALRIVDYENNKGESIDYDDEDTLIPELKDNHYKDEFDLQEALLNSIEEELKKSNYDYWD